MRDWSPERVAEAAGARLVAAGAAPGGPGARRHRLARRPARATCSSACPASNVDGGRFAAAGAGARARGACSSRPSTPTRPAARSRARCSPPTTRSPRCSAWPPRGAARSARRSSGSPARRARRRRRTCSPRCSRRTGASSPRAQNLNTEIGLPLTVLGAPPGTEVLVLEMAMRGAGQIAELARDRRARRRRDRQRRPGPPRAAGHDRGDRRGQGRAASPACAPGGTAVVPAGEPLLEPHRRDDVDDRDLRPGRRRRRAPGRARAAVRRRAHMRRNALAALAAARAVGVEPDGRGRRRAVEPARPADRARPAASSSSTTATTPTRCRCAPPSTTSPRPRPGAASPCSATCSSSAPTRRASTREIGAYARDAGVDVLVTVGPLARAHGDGFDGAASAPTRRGGRRARPRAAARRATPCWSRPRAASASRSSPRRWRTRLMGEVLIARHRRRCSSASSCRRRFIAFLRDREFGQHIREEGPEGHHEKAGTPTMGGIIIFTADLGPVPDPQRLRLALGRGLRRGDGVRAARLRRRLHEDRQAPLARACAARTKLLRDDRDLARAVVDGHPEGRAAATRCACARSTPRSTSASSTRCSSTSWSRARRARSTSPTASTAWPPAARRSSLLAYIGITFITPRPARPRAARAAAWSAPASASCGSTRSRRRSSWATPARSGSAGRSPGWR